MKAVEVVSSPAGRWRGGASARSFAIFLGLLAGTLAGPSAASIPRCLAPLVERLPAPRLALRGDRVVVEVAPPGGASAWMNGVVALAGPAVGVPQFSRLYREFRHADPAIYPARRLLDAMNIRVVVDPEDVARVPAVGPLVVVANHPRFGLDGLAIADAVRSVRADVKVMVNAFMGALPEIVENAIPVPTSLKGKAEALRAAGTWLEQGGALVVFPAGDVSADWDGTRYVDPPWQVGAVRLAQRHRAHVLPAFVDGGPSSFYARVRAFHPSLAYPLMLREFLAQRDGTITLRFREAVDGGTLAAIPADRALEALRAAVYDGEEVAP